MLNNRILRRGRIENALNNIFTYSLTVVSATMGYNLDQINQVIEYVCEYKSEQETILAIDDYHLIEHNKQIGTLVELIVQEEIPNLHIVLLTRTRPNFKYLNLLSKGLCYYLDSTIDSGQDRRD